MKPAISLPQIPGNIDNEMRDFLTALLKVITEKQLDEYSTIEAIRTDITNLKK